MFKLKSGVISLLSVFMLFLTFIPWAWGQSADMKGEMYGAPETFAEIHGFVNFKAYDFDTQSATPPDTISNSFDLSDLYLSAKAKIQKNVTVFGEIHADQGTYSLDNAFINIQVQPIFNLQIGRYFVPFGIDKVESTKAPFNKLVSTPLVLTQLSYGEWSDIGINLYGKAPLNPLTVAYDVAVLKGPNGLLQESLGNQDNNKNKLVLGRVHLLNESSDDFKFSLGASGAYGKYDDTGSKLVRLLGADGKMQWRGLELRGEFVKRGGDDSTPADLCGGAACSLVMADGEGYYLQASYLLLKDLPAVYALEPVVRFDKSDLPDQSYTHPDTARRIVTVGLLYAPYPHLKFKGEYEMVKNDGTDLHNDGMMFSVTADF
jgi:hypothetical protein